MVSSSSVLRDLFAALLLASVVACSGSSAGSSAGDSTLATGDPDNSGAAGSTDDEAYKRQQALQRHRARQEAACEQVGRVLTRCAIEDARQSMPPEEFAKLDVDKLGPAHQAEFFDKCTASDMSVRQINVFETCVTAETECNAFVTCLDNAQPQP